MFFLGRIFFDINIQYYKNNIKINQIIDKKKKNLLNLTK